MLTQSQLDEGSSTGTTEDGPLRTHSSEDDEVSLTNENDGWGVVNEAGVLILDGEEGETPELSNEGDQLSVPGADSLPTIVGSIEALTRMEPEDTKIGEIGSTEAEVEPPSDFQENAQIGPNASSKGDPSGIPNQKFLLLLAVSISILLGVTLANYRGQIQNLREQVNILESKRIILEDRNSVLLGELVPLEAELAALRPLEKEVVALRSINKSLHMLQQQVEDLKDENERMKLDEQLRLEECKKECEGAALVDNCWVKADVQLGDCAKEATGTIKDVFYASLFYQLFNTSATNPSTPSTHSDGEPDEDEYEVTVTKILNKMDSLGKDVGSKIDSIGKSFWKSIEATSAESDRKLADLFSKMDDKAKAWFRESFGHSSETGKGESSTDGDKPKPGALDDVVKGFSQMLHAGDAIVTKVLAMASEALEMNETDVLTAMEQMVKDASFAYQQQQDRNDKGASSSEEQPVSSGLAEIVNGLSQMLAVGDTVMTNALSKTMEAMGLNETEMLMALEEMVKDASLAQQMKTEGN